VLPQDYHLYLVPYFLRQMIGQRAMIQPFVHIPWPGPDAWRILPAEIRDFILQGMLSADRVGFQTRKDAFNWVQTCRFYLPDAHSHGARDAITFAGHRVMAQSYPISIDVTEIEELVQDAETMFFKSQFVDYVKDRKLILRVDRVEPSKNILRGLEAFASLLERYPEYLGEVAMLALLVPSRLEVSEYQDYLREIMAMAGMINAKYSDSLWEPVRIIVGDNYNRALAAMQLFDVLLVNPIADGMNLVAKEGVLVNQRNGVLVLSEHAGAFYELGEQALSVSPFDVFGTAEALHHALTLDNDDRFERMNQLKSVVRNSDVNQWFNDQVADLLNFFTHQARNEVTSSIEDTAPSA
jgi:trehalose 6-phosphate synthase